MIWPSFLSTILYKLLITEIKSYGKKKEKKKKNPTSEDSLVSECCISAHLYCNEIRRNDTESFLFINITTKPIIFSSFPFIKHNRAP